MSTKVSGNGTLFKVDTFGGGAVQTVVDQVDLTLTITADILDGTTKSDSQWHYGVYGNRRGEISVSGNIDSVAGGDTTGQQLMITEIITTRGRMDWEITEVGTGKAFTGDMLVGNYTLSYPQNGIQTFSASCTTHGAVAYS